MGEHDKAIRQLSFAIRESPSWDDAYGARAESYEQLGDTKNAAADRAEAARRREAL
jgi:Tfp pilus assembly protein PilF